MKPQGLFDAGLQVHSVRATNYYLLVNNFLRVAQVTEYPLHPCRYRSKTFVQGRKQIVQRVRAAPVLRNSLLC